MYMMVESRVVDPLEVGGHVLAGYFTHMELSDEEFDALKMCVAGRFAQVIITDYYFQPSALIQIFFLKRIIFF